MYNYDYKTMCLSVSVNLSEQDRSCCFLYIIILLYKAETWTIKAPDARRLTAFHNGCVRSTLGVLQYQQW